MDYLNNRGFKFVDLFAGIGGFHAALSQLGGQCVLASEIDSAAIETYEANYGIDANKDIRKLSIEDVPDHDVLCAGFPCQPFSKGGGQAGFGDETRGTLFFEIARILKHKKPSYIILENVRNLISHDNGNTWRVIKSELNELGYVLTEAPLIISPHQLGIPQLRERVYILGAHKSLGINHLDISVPSKKKTELSIFTSGVLEENKIDNEYQISDYEEYVLNAWDEFYKGVKEVVIGFPVWAYEFKQTYDVSDFPKWKQDFCLKNRMLYANNRGFIDAWLTKYHNLEDFKPTDRKFEWQCGDSCDSVWDGIIQFRPSGIRVKRPDTFPALVAMVHIPIIGKYKRRLTPREVANLQSFPPSFKINSNDRQAYKQFGNAVNVSVVRHVAEQLFNQQ